MPKLASSNVPFPKQSCLPLTSIAKIKEKRLKAKLYIRAIIGGRTHCTKSVNSGAKTLIHCKPTSTALLEI